MKVKPRHVLAAIAADQPLYWVFVTLLMSCAIVLAGLLSGQDTFVAAGSIVGMCACVALLALIFSPRGGTR